MFRLIHLSDLHLAPLPPVKTSAFFSKRATGWLNWRYTRSRLHQRDVLDALRADIIARKPDHIVITGDLTNLALHREFVAVREWLATLGDQKMITIVPGNHDAYVPGARSAFARIFSDYLGDRNTGENPFPFVRRVGPLRLIGLSSANATPPFFSSGRLGKNQSRAACDLVSDAHDAELFTIALLHHPPTGGLKIFHKRLTDPQRLYDIIEAQSVDLVLHGHTHTRLISRCGHGNIVPSLGVPSASCAGDAHHPRAGYNILDFEDADAGRSIAITARDVMADGSLNFENGSEIDLGFAEGTR